MPDSKKCKLKKKPRKRTPKPKYPPAFLKLTKEWKESILMLVNNYMFLADARAKEASMNFSRDAGNPEAHKESFKRTIQYDTAKDIARMINNRLENLP
jgi:hypothetical protein